MMSLYDFSSAMLDLMVNLFLFAFAEEMYPAIAASLDPSLISYEWGLILKISGYSDKLPVSFYLMIFVL